MRTRVFSRTTYDKVKDDLVQLKGITISSEELPAVDSEFEVTFHKNGQILLNPINHGKDHRDPGDPSQ